MVEQELDWLSDFDLDRLSHNTTKSVEADCFRSVKAAVARSADTVQLLDRLPVISLDRFSAACIRSVTTNHTRSVLPRSSFPCTSFSFKVYLKTSCAQDDQDASVYALRKTSYKKRNDKSQNRKNDKNEEEEEAYKYEDTHVTSHRETEDSLVPHPPSSKTVLVNFIKPKLSKLLSSYDFRSFISSELKELSSKFIVLSREVKELKKHIQRMEIELPGNLKEILNKLKTFTSNIYIQAKLKTLDALPRLLNKVTNTLNRFAHIMENASPKAGDKGVPSAGQVGASPAEKNTNQAIIS
nr:hypothetical protein [Tanacetum cinerariifolium]